MLVISLQVTNSCSQKQQVNVALMTHVLETCDLVSYSDAQGQPEWEQAMQDEMNSLLKNHTWDLVPQPQGKNIVKCDGSIRPNLPLKVLLSIIKLAWL
jgi:hypothetical protein